MCQTPSRYLSGTKGKMLSTHVPEIYTGLEITIAACAFAAVLYKVITSDMVASALESVVGKALDVPF
ncbi:DUF4244 domain-containing protein [Streptomyces sp. ISL-98]|nr:DUF4244 domain-containing protein [Streptomyces sp. ISL-98]